MAPKSKKRQSSHYDSDNGFVANDNDSGDEGTHRSKKVKTSAKSKNGSGPSSSSFKSASAAAAAGGGEKKVDSNGDTYWELSRLRRVTVSSFKGRTLVNVREYYEKDGQELPGKKGISMPIDQFSSMIRLLPDIEAALKEKGETLPRPEYDVNGGKAGEKNEDEDEDEDDGDGDGTRNDEEDASEEEEEEEEGEKPRSKKAKKSKKNGARKKNIEATSDEDE